MEEHNILVGTPAYNGQVHIDYVESLTSIQRAGVKFELCLLGKESLITRARNEIVSHFFRSERFTHLLFLDSDISLKGDDVVALLDHKKDVIGARVPLKTYREDGGLIYNTGKELAQLGKLLLVARVGTAVLLLSRRAIKDLVAESETSGRVYRINTHRSDLPRHAMRYEVFRVGTRFGEYLSEDFWLCHQLRELGYGIYVDPAISVGHTGMHRFSR